MRILKISILCFAINFALYSLLTTILLALPCGAQSYLSSTKGKICFYSSKKDNHWSIDDGGHDEKDDDDDFEVEDRENKSE